MGRKKIKIERITDDRTRSVTFVRRKKGLVKKAMELSLLCDCQVALIIVDSTTREITGYSSQENIDEVLTEFAEADEISEKYSNKDYDRLHSKEDEDVENSSRSSKATLSMASTSKKRHRPTDSQLIARNTRQVQRIPGFGDQPKPAIQQHHIQEQQYNYPPNADNLIVTQLLTPTSQPQQPHNFVPPMVETFAPTVYETSNNRRMQNRRKTQQNTTYAPSSYDSFSDNPRRVNTEIAQFHMDDGLRQPQISSTPTSQPRLVPMIKSENDLTIGEPYVNDFFSPTSFLEGPDEVNTHSLQNQESPPSIPSIPSSTKSQRKDS